MFSSFVIRSVACLASLSVAFTTLAPSLAQPNSQQIQWIDDFQTAIRYATSNNLPLLLHFYGDNCPPCRLLEKKAFRDPELIGKINGQVVAVRINGEKQKELRDRYQVTRWPTDVYLLPNGEEVYRTVSPQDPSVYGQMIDRVALRHRDWKAGEIAAAQANEHRLANRTSTQIAMDRRPTPSTSIASTGSHPVMSSAQTAARSPSANQAPAPSANPTPSAIQPMLAAQSALPPSQDPPSIASQRVISNPHLAAGPLVVPPAAAPAAIAQPTLAAPTAPDAKVAGLPATTIATRTASQPEPSVGLDGFCPVSLYLGAKSTDPNRTVWTEGSPKFAVKHRGRIYLCASDAYRQEFLRAPDLYAPCLSCFDLIHYIKTQQLVDGKCEFGCFQADTGRVFLFATQEHCDEFRRNESYYSQLIQHSSEPERVASQPDGSPVR
ncbi:DUF255 domain-containing protein [Pirellulaceae bacterium SH467]